ncbi:MAG: lamin tail domain-containing protein [Patescibacteria group bacterium]
MKSKSFCRVILIAYSLALSIPLLAINPRPAQAVEPHIYISEIAWAGSTLSTADEWLELSNPTLQDISIAGWRLTGVGASSRPLALPPDAMILAGGAYLIANYGADDAHCSLAIQPNAVSTTVSIPNDKLLVQLWDANGQLIDQAGTNAAPPAGYSKDIKASMVRVDFLMSGDLPTAWKTADSSQNLKTSDFGTPGIVDIELVTSEPIVEPGQIVEEVETQTTSTIDVIGVDEGLDTSTSTDITTTTVELVEIQPNEIAATSSTDIIDLETTTSTPSIQETATTTSFTLQTTVETLPIVAPVTITPNSYQFLRLNEVASYPASGPEWLELTSAAPDRTISLDGLGIYDTSGKITTLHGVLSPTQTYFVFRLSSARFNNGGDSIYIKTPDGQVLDTLTYGPSHKGVAWARDSFGAWRETVTLTPSADNIISDLPVTPSKTSTTAEASSSKKVGKSPANSKPKTSTKTQTSSTSTKDHVITTAAKKTVAKVEVTSKSQPKTTSAAPKTTVKKTTTKTATSASSSKLPVSIDFDMLQDDSYGGIRVKIKGIAGSLPRMLSGRAFVLLNLEGRGLSVRLDAGRKMPALGSTLEISGTLKFDTHDFAYLSLTKTDKLTILNANIATSTPREIMWLAPAAEDAWSLAIATGTVQTVSASTISLLVDDAEVDVKIKPGVNYRASRLKKGDIINVTGILDMTSSRVAILPRRAEEITLVAHAPDQTAITTPQKAQGLPGWTPFGAALGAIGAIEGVKKLRSRKKTKVAAA